MRCSKLRYYSDLELASTSKKIDKDEFFEVPKMLQAGKTGQKPAKLNNC